MQNTGLMLDTHYFHLIFKKEKNKKNTSLDFLQVRKQVQRGDVTPPRSHRL